MALLKSAIYHKMQKVFVMFEEGKLRGQKQREMKGLVLQKALEGKLAPKLHHFKIFQGIDVSMNVMSHTPFLLHSANCVCRIGRRKT